MPSILFVCTANICRSPMAEAILIKLVSSRPDASEWHIESAGTWAIAGCHAAELSQAVMHSWGLDISSHLSQPITKDLIQRFDLILTMENNHKEGLITQFRQFSNRTYMLSEMAGIIKDIPDPIGRQIMYYQETAHLLENLLTAGLERIYQQAEYIHKSTGRYTEN